MSSKVIKVKHKGSFKKTERFMNFLKGNRHLNSLEKYGELGVEALAAATPIDSGLTATLWKYEITKEKGKVSIKWLNTNIQNGINVVILLRYGHGTGTGGYVEGVDFISPAIKPIFDQIADGVWKEVEKA